MLDSSNTNVFTNRTMQRHGFSTCGICQIKLMAYLEKGHGLDDVMKLMKEKHPSIKNIRAYSQNAIRQTTGYGIYDDYIIQHNLWTVRNPIIADAKTHKELVKLWAQQAEKGRELTEMDNKVADAAAKDPELEKMFRHVYSIAKSPVNAI